MDSEISSKLKDMDFNVRYRALDDVTDEDTLIKVATEDFDDYIRYKAYIRLRVHHPDSFILFDAYFVSKITNELLLTYIVRDSMYSSPKLVCGHVISRDDLVPYLVLYDRRWEIRAAAVRNPHMRDENLLKDVVLYDYHQGVRKAAMSNPNLEIQSLFELMARHDSDSGIRCQATKRLDDEELLVDLALNDSNGSVRWAAVENPNLRNETALIYAAFNDCHTNVRLAAIDRITDEKALARIACEDKVRKVKAKAVGRLKMTNPDSIYLIEDVNVGGVDDAKLPEIANNAISLKSRIEAVKKIKDSLILADIARHASRWRVRRAAAQSPYLHNARVLGIIALNDSSPRVRKAAFSNPNFRNEAVLTKVSKTDSNESNRFYALNKLDRIKHEESDK